MTQGSLFDGAGGLRIGFELAGFKTEWTLDLQAGQDIKIEKAKNYKKVDLISGGPPCQRGSFAANFSRSRDSTTLWSEMLQFTEKLRPKWVVVESTIGFLPEMVQKWTSQLQQLGYGCAGQCISSRHWVPQIRTRAFIIGRLEVTGVALWNHLFSNRVGRIMEPEIRSKISNSSQQQYRPCSNCLRNGVPTRISSHHFACVGAGNAVTVPLATFLGNRILLVEDLIQSGTFINNDVKRLF